MEHMEHQKPYNIIPKSNPSLGRTKSCQQRDTQQEVQSLGLIEKAKNEVFCTYYSSLFTLFFILPCVTVALSLNTFQIEVMNELTTFLPSWKNGTSDPCQWHGVVCNGTDVVELNLSGMGLKGNIWPTVCRLPALQTLNVSNNSFSTPSSKDIGSCTSLVALNVSNNGMSGTLPSLNPLQKLQSLVMSDNSLEGGFGPQIQSLADLRELILKYNRLIGPIPSVLEGLKLEKLDVFHNKLTGGFPQGLTKCTNLTYLDLSGNRLRGRIPESISNLANLETLIVSSNGFSGALPKTLGNLTKLTVFLANENELSGAIPVELASIRGLESLYLSDNHLTGPIPPQVLSVRSLRSLDLTSNSLAGRIPQNISGSLIRLRIGNNNLNGTIPSTVADASQLTYLEMNNNSLEGKIPEQLGNCTNLLLLDLGQNQFTGSLTSVLPRLLNLQYLKLFNNHFDGSILNGLSNMTNLTYVDLRGNLLSGSLPSKLFELNQLQFLYLNDNHLTGTIPENIQDCKSLLELQLASNNLTGKIPLGIGMLNTLQIAVNLSYNYLEGSIPDTLSNLQFLQMLDLSNNRLSGEIPDTLSHMSLLEMLDLSNNRLRGEIPTSLTNLKGLTTLNLSNNDLTGIIPTFGNTANVITTGNPHLIHKKSGSSTSKKKKVSAGLIVGIAVAGAIFALGVFALSILACKYLQHNEHEMAEKQEPHTVEGHFIHPSGVQDVNIDFEKGVEATTDPANIILRNKFGIHYRAVMPSGISYSVKKLSWTEKIFKSGSYRRLDSELEKQGRLHHPNIMSPLAYVVHTECAYLFYEYVHKGSLAEFLHTSGVCILDWPSRCSIAIGIAQGLAFLHGYQHPILHLDLTTKNIVLKSLSEAQIADIEICRIVDPSNSTGSLSAIAGSVGYIPPEYAYTMTVTAAVNVFSFGVILLELLTGKPPITSEMNLVKWVQSTLSEEGDGNKFLT